MACLGKGLRSLQMKVQFCCTLHLWFLHIVTVGWLCMPLNECSEGGELLAAGRSYFVRQAVKLVGNCMAGGAAWWVFSMNFQPWVGMYNLSVLFGSILTHLLERKER